MTNIRFEMNFYECAKEYAVMVLFNDDSGESASICWYFKSQRKAQKQLETVKLQYVEA